MKTKIIHCVDKNPHARATCNMFCPYKCTVTYLVYQPFYREMERLLTPLLLRLNKLLK
jgi:hypothetical protein